MNIPTHKRRFQSESSISIDDMIDWSDEEEPMEEETAPHLLGSLSNLDSFGMEDGHPSSHCTSSMREGDDPLSRRDSVFNPSPLVLSVRKIYGDEEEASIESATSTFRINHASNAPKHLPPTPPTNVSMLPPPSTGMNSSISSIQSAPPRRVSDASAMAVDTNMSTSQPTPSNVRRGSHRRDSANSLPTDLEEVMMSFRVMT